jgi:hypothetical protein
MERVSVLPRPRLVVLALGPEGARYSARVAAKGAASIASERPRPGAHLPL